MLRFGADGVKAKTPRIAWRFRCSSFRRKPEEFHNSEAGNPAYSFTIDDKTRTLDPVSSYIPVLHGMTVGTGSRIIVHPCTVRDDARGTGSRVVVHPCTARDDGRNWIPDHRASMHCPG